MKQITLIEVVLSDGQKLPHDLLASGPVLSVGVVGEREEALQAGRHARRPRAGSARQGFANHWLFHTLSPVVE